MDMVRNDYDFYNICEIFIFYYLESAVHITNILICFLKK